MTEAKCFDCELPYIDEGFQDLIISEEAWRAISPDGEGNGLLCPNCILRRLQGKGIKATGSFRSGPLSIINQEDRIETLTKALKAARTQIITNHPLASVIGKIDEALGVGPKG